MHVSRAKATMVVMSEVWMVRWVGCFRWCLPMWEWWNGLPVAWTSTVVDCIDESVLGDGVEKADQVVIGGV